MGRPSKSAKVLHPKSQTKEEINNRLIVEEKLKGLTTLIKPSNRLNANQKKIFNYIVEQLEASELLGNLDLYVLEHTSIAIDRLQNIEKLINQDFERMFDRDIVNAKTKYTADFNKGVENLSLSPASRAKFGIMSLEKAQNEADPLLRLLKKKG
jgi:phage terminase small subunit